MVKDTDTSSMTQTIALGIERVVQSLDHHGCSNDVQRGHEVKLNTLEVKLEAIIDGQGEILKRLDKALENEQQNKSDIADLKRDRHWVATIAGAIGALITAVLSGAFILFHK